MGRVNDNNIEQNKILKESVTAALLKLMETDEYDKIFITDICNTAGVSRMGFYRNYKSKDDVIADITHDFYQKAKDDVGQYFNCVRSEKRKWYLDYFKYLLDNERSIKTMYMAGFQGRTLNEITSLLIAGEQTTSEEEKTKRILFYGALFNLTLRWLLDESRVSIDHMADYCLKYIKE